jgi:hypothetical protein
MEMSLLMTNAILRQREKRMSKRSRSADSSPLKTGEMITQGYGV